MGSSSSPVGDQADATALGPQVEHDDPERDVADQPRKNLLHRDLKPANVIVTPDGEVKVLDFGLATLFERSDTVARSQATTQLGDEDPAPVGLAGTLPYMSPEQARMEALDSRSDVFSLGTMLYEMTTGHLPFTGPTSAEVLRSVQRARPQPVHDIVPRVPLELDRIIQKAMAPRRGDRYQAVEDLAVDLKRLGKELESGSSPSYEALHELSDRTIRRVPRRGSAILIGLAALTIIVAAVAAFFLLRPTAVSKSEVKRIVVLPFENLGAPDEAYFAGGMTDEITSRLAVVSGLRVISRNSAMRYAGTTKTMQEVGDELDVNYVLVGTVRWDRGAEGRGRVRITPQLIQVSDDSNLWADVYERRLEDVFAVQSEIAERVARELGIALLGPEEETLAVRPTENMEAYNLYLRGLSLSWPMSTSHELDVAAGLFERATRLDPGFALPWSDLARIHGYWKQADLPGADAELAARAIEEALRLAPHSPDVRSNAGWYYYFVLRDYPRANDSFEKAIELRPSDSVAYLGLAATRRGEGRFEEAVRAYKTAIELDPRYAEHYRDTAGTLSNMRRYAEADEYYRKGMELAPDVLGYYVLRSRNYLRWDGDTERAGAVLETWPGGPLHEYLSRVEMLNRNWSGALEHLSAMDEQTPGTYLRECSCRLRLGQRDLAQTACESARRLLENELRDRPDAAPLHSSLGQAYALLARADDAIREGRRATELRPLSDHANNNTTFLLRLAEIYATVGDDDAAIDQLDQLLSIPSPISVPLLRLDPIWDPLRDNPKFTELVDKYEL